MIYKPCLKNQSDQAHEHQTNTTQLHTLRVFILIKTQQFSAVSSSYCGETQPEVRLSTATSKAKSVLHAIPNLIVIQAALPFLHCTTYLDVAVGGWVLP